MATAVIINDLNNSVKFIEPKNYSIITIKDPKPSVKIEEILPFRIKFTAVQIQDIRGMIPTIPLQVIGYSNYIL
jgi:hypothetical protein